MAGPTGVGKSALALEVARRVGGEILSADSRQLYRGMDVGTAAPTSEDRALVPHHGLDLLDPGERATAGAFRDFAECVVEDIHGRGRPLVVVGGSTLYVHALVEGLADLPAVERDLEGRLMDQINNGGSQRLFDELRAVDPAAAATLDPTKTHRLVRLVGVLRQTGRTPSALWEETARPPLPARLVVLDRPREELYRRIDRRVERMIEDGLVEEVRRLAEDPSARSTLKATIGYRELLPVLEGDRPMSEAVRLIQRDSRRYAKRQLTWYRRYEDATWLDARTATADDVLRAVAPWPAAGDPQGEAPSPPDDQDG